jgi:uncharacterized protein (DUF1015 family)
VVAVAPFRGIRYDPDAVGNLSSVTSPPYDVISPEAQASFEDASPYNIVRLILGREERADDALSNKYTRARSLLEAWLASGVLVRDPVDALYVYEQRFAIRGEERTQRGVLAAVRLEEPENGRVLPHERTMPKPVEDRLALLRAAGANLEPVFGVAAGGGLTEALRPAALHRPHAEFASGDDGVRHRLWVVTDPAAIKAVRAGMRDAVVIIADGHHRYRTAMIHRDERRAAEGAGPWDSTLMYVVDAEADGPAVLPIHRVARGVDADTAIERLRPAFAAEPAERDDPERLAAELATRRAAGRCYAIIDADRAWILTVADTRAEREAVPADRSAAWRDLDVAVLHALAFERLLGGVETDFVHSAREAAEAVEKGDASFAVLLAPVPFESVRAVALAGEAMPSKSTYFFPKPRNGVVIRPLDEAT